MTAQTIKIPIDAAKPGDIIEAIHLDPTLSPHLTVRRNAMDDPEWELLRWEEVARLRTMEQKLVELANDLHRAFGDRPAFSNERTMIERVEAILEAGR